MRPHFRLSVLVAVLAASTLALAANPRIVAVGDIHGDFDGAVSILQDARLIDASHHWTGGNAVLVQTGDLLDRGPKSREVMDLFMALESEAPRSGGRVVVLLGNHEAMNIMGDLRYVTPQGFSEYATPKSEKLRDSEYDKYVSWSRDRKKAGAPVATELSREAWMAQHPAGYFEQRQMLSPKGRYGRWLRQRPAVFEMDGTAFVHGGFGPSVASETLPAIDSRIHSEIAAFDRDVAVLASSKVILASLNWEELSAALNSEIHRRVSVGEKSSDETAAALAELSQSPKWLSVSPEGPLWYRGYDRLPDAELAEQLSTFMKSQSIRHVVAGHTPQAEHQIRSRAAGSVFEIDTGMLSSYFGGQPSALEIQDGNFTAIYKDRRTVLLPVTKSTSSAEVHTDEHHTAGGAAADNPPAPYLTYRFLGPDGQTLPFKSDEEILEFLRTADIVDSKNTSTGVNETRKLLLEKNGVKAHAVFRLVNIDHPPGGSGVVGDPVFNDSYIMEPPAYELSKYLGIPYVPPATLRTINNQKGSLQLWIENAMDEEKRKKTGAKPTDPSRWNNYIHTMHVWDNLVCNTDRNLGNILIDHEWNVWYIDHTRAFWRHTDLIAPKEIVRVERHFFEHIQTMDHDKVRAMLQPYLKPAEIDTLFKRQQKLVEYVNKLIREKGENNVLYTYTPAVIEMLPAK